MAPPHLTQDTNAVLKLHLSDKDETRRIALRKLWSDDSANVSFQHLVDLAIQYSEVEQEKVSKVCITYTDEDGDTITISSDEELAEAFCQFVDKVPPVVRAYAKVNHNKNSNPRVEAPIQQRRQQKQMMQLKKQQLKMQERLERRTREFQRVHERKHPAPAGKPEVVEEPQPNAVEEPKVVPMKQNNVFGSQPPKNMPTATNETVPSVKVEPKLNRPKIPSSFNPNFIHGRHTCDGCFTSPIIGIRFNATNRPDYDLCQNCFKNYQGDAVRFLPEQLDRDVHLQQRWRNRQVRRQKRDTMGRVGRANGCGPMPPACPVRFNDVTVDEFSKSALDEAIRLSLLSNGKKAEAEVQTKEDKGEPKEEAKKADTPKEEVAEPTVEPAQAEPKVEAEPKAASVSPAQAREDSIKDIVQGMFEDPLKKPTSAAAMTLAKQFAELLKQHKVAKAHAAASPPAEPSVEEAVADKKESVTGNESVPSAPSPVEAKVTATDEPEIEVAKDEVVVEDASVEEPEPEVKVPSTNTEISIEPIDTLVLEIEKPQIAEPSQVSEDDISYTSQRNEDDISYASQPGEMILDGDDADAAESQSQGGSSNGDWQVVDEDGQDVSDEMMAQAAQLLGSALFESDANVAATDNNNDVSNSIVSGLTSVPSITTARSQISRVLLNRWEDELRQLHELGFLDDHANVEAFGHLEAANMGVGSNDPITVEKVVNYLLNQ